MTPSRRLPGRWRRLPLQRASGWAVYQRQRTRRRPTRSKTIKAAAELPMRRRVSLAADEVRANPFRGNQMASHFYFCTAKEKKER